MAEGSTEQHARGPVSLISLLKGIKTLLALIIVVDGADVALRLWGIGVFPGMLARSDTALADRFDHMSQVLIVAAALLTVVCGICWITWQARLAGMAPGYVKWSPGWQAGAWFIPFASLWWPYRNVRDLGDLYLPGRWKLLVKAWWLAWVVSLLMDRVVTRMITVEYTAASLRHYESWILVTDLVNVAAAVMAGVLVSRLTQGAQIVLVPEGPATAG